MKKTISTFLAIIMAMTMVAGCSKEEEDSVPKKKKAEETTETVKVDPDTVDSEGRTKLLIGLPGGDGVTAMKVVDTFKNKFTEYNITTDEGAWSDFTKKVKLQIVADDNVTPVFFSDSEQVFSFGAEGAAMDLKDWIDTTFDAEKYNKALYAVVDEVSDPGNTHVWGVPHAVNSIAMVYNKDVFDKYGVAYPTEDWTFDDMFAMARKLTKDTNGDGETDIWGIDYYHNSTQGWLPFMLAYGANPYRDNFRNANLTDPKVIEAMKAMRAPMEEGICIPDAERQALGGAPMAFGEGKVAMSLVQYNSIAAINRNYPDLNYDAIIMPYGPSGVRPCVYVPNSWMIYSGAADNVKNAALDFLAYYLSEEAQMINAKECPSGFPIMKAALEVAAEGKKPAGTDAFFKGIDEHGSTVLENPVSSKAAAVMNVLGGGAKNYQSGKSIEQLCEEANEKLQSELDYYYEGIE